MADESKCLRNNMYESEMKLRRGEKCILIAGSTDDDSRKLIYNHLFDLEYNSSERIIKANNFTIIDYSDFNRSSFKFKQFENNCEQIKKNLRAIICIENLNPRPETMLKDIQILNRVYDSDFLKKHLYFICTLQKPKQDYCQNKSLEKVRNEFLHLTDFFSNLDINGESNVNEFVQKKIWILNKDNIDLKDLQSIIENSSKNLNSMSLIV